MYKFNTKVLGKTGPRFSIDEISIEEFPYARFFFRLKRLPVKDCYWAQNSQMVNFQEVGCRVREGEYRENIFYTTGKIGDKVKIFKRNGDDQLIPNTKEIYFKNRGRFYKITFEDRVGRSNILDFMDEYKEKIIELKNPPDIIDFIIFKEYI